MTRFVAKPPLKEIQAAQTRIAPHILRTPLIRLEHENAPAEIYLKLENLQPIGSFKLRGAGNAMAVLDPHQLRLGVYTASAGNMAQGVAWNARRLGVRCQVVVPNDAPMAKLEAITRLRAEIIQVPYAEWWDVMTSHRYGDLDGHFIHPVSNKHVVAGNATIGLEIAEQLPDVQDVVVPFGGGGLSCGIAAAFEGLNKNVNVHAAEVETAAPPHGIVSRWRAGEYPTTTELCGRDWRAKCVARDVAAGKLALKQRNHGEYSKRCARTETSTGASPHRCRGRRCGGRCRCTHRQGRHRQNCVCGVRRQHR